MRPLYFLVLWTTFAGSARAVTDVCFCVELYEDALDKFHVDVTQTCSGCPGYGTQMTISCSTGYANATGIATCVDIGTYFGEWRVSMNCTKLCNTSDLVFTASDTRAVGCTGYKTAGQTCTATCAAGLLGAPNFVATCNATAGWDIVGTLDQCYLECDTANLVGFTTSDAAPASCFALGSVPPPTTCAAVCANGRLGVPDYVATCQRDGTWAYTGTPSQCYYPYVCDTTTLPYSATDVAPVGCRVADAIQCGDAVCGAVCAAGLLGAPDFAATCNGSTGNWMITGSANKCHLPRACPAKDITGWSTTDVPDAACVGNITHGAQCHAVCACGYGGVPDYTCTCNDGAWTCTGTPNLCSLVDLSGITCDLAAFAWNYNYIYPAACAAGAGFVPACTDCTPSCSPGNHGVGLPIICDATGNWAGFSGGCAADPCPTDAIQQYYSASDVPTPDCAAGQWRGDDMCCFAQCAPGYHDPTCCLNNPLPHPERGMTYCNHGNWSVGGFFNCCEPIPCDLADLATVFSLTDIIPANCSTGSAPVGTVCAAECAHGLYGLPTLKATCIVGVIKGAWDISGSAHMCSTTIPTCDPGTIVGWSSTDVRPASCAGNITLGHSCTAVCAPNTIGDTTFTATCGYLGWNYTGTPTKCLPVTCTLPTVSARVAYGVDCPSGSLLGDAVSGTHCTLTCRAGYTDNAHPTGVTGICGASGSYVYPATLNCDAAVALLPPNAPIAAISSLTPLLTSLAGGARAIAYGQHWVPPLLSVRVGSTPIAEFNVSADATSRRLLQTGTASLTFFLPSMPSAGYYSLVVSDAAGQTASFDNQLYYTDDCPYEGYYGRGLDCQPCPDGAVCPGGYRMWPQQGYWNSGEESGFVQACPAPATRCTGGRQGTCADGYTGALCVSCSTGYYASGSACEKCNASDTTVLYVVLAIFILLMAVAFVFLSDDAIRRVFDIVKALQLVYIVGRNFNDQLPGFVHFIFGNLSLVTFDYSFVRPTCSTITDTFASLFWGNAVLIALAVAPTMMAVAFLRKRNVSFYTHRLVLATTVFVTLMYLVVCTRIFSALACQRVGDRLVLIADSRITCYKDDVDIKTIAWIGLLAITAVPIAVTAKLAALAKTDKLDDVAALASYGHVYKTLARTGYRYFFAPMSFVQIFILAALSCFLALQPAARYASMTILFLVACGAVVAWRPYATRTNNVIQLASYFGGFLTSMLSWLAASNLSKDALLGVSVTVAVILAIVCLIFVGFFGGPSLKRRVVGVGARVGPDDGPETEKLAGKYKLEKSDSKPFLAGKDDDLESLSSPNSPPIDNAVDAEDGSKVLVKSPSEELKDVVPQKMVDRNPNAEFTPLAESSNSDAASVESPPVAKEPAPGELLPLGDSDPAVRMTPTLSHGSLLVTAASVTFEVTQESAPEP